MRCMHLEYTCVLLVQRVCGQRRALPAPPAGRVLDLEIIARGRVPLPDQASPARPASPAPEWVLVRPLRLGVGLVQFEVQRGGVLSEAVSLVALPSREAVAEAQQAQRELAGGVVDPYTRRLSSV
jgi:hypothetical protein